jgi:nicotinate-nucleotide adenylyltransferase
LKIGILGGTFDPIHLGHLRTAEEVGEALGLHKVCLIPSSYPPHKSVAPITPFPHRMAMTKLAAAGSSVLEALDLEGRRPGFSYSIETLRELKQISGPESDLYFILGTDAFLEIETWKDYHLLFDYAHFVVIQRGGHECAGIEPFIFKLRKDARQTEAPRTWITKSGKTIRILSVTSLAISSTVLRQALASGKSIRFLVPEAVIQYINNKGLYLHHGIN